MKQSRAFKKAIKATTWQFTPTDTPHQIINKFLFISKIGALSFIDKNHKKNLVIHRIGWDDTQNNEHTAYMLFELVK